MLHGDEASAGSGGLSSDYGGMRRPHANGHRHVIADDFTFVFRDDFGDYFNRPDADYDDDLDR